METGLIIVGILIMVVVVLSLLADRGRIKAEAQRDYIYYRTLNRFNRMMEGK